MRYPFLLASFAAVVAWSQTPEKITTPKEFLGSNIGDDYFVANYTQLEGYWKKLASESNRMKLVDIGLTAEGRHQWMAIITAPENLKRLDHYKEISARLAHAEGLTDDQALALAREGKAIVWIDGGLHASETVGSQQLMESVYQMLVRNDAETQRFLNDTIGLYVLANPDGQELVANWYMREPDPKKRSLERLPRLYQKYIGHDNNRDFFTSNMPETTNMNRQLFLEWFPQIVYNHHQTGPAGTVIFVPPFRDPFNYNFDPLIPLGIEMVGTAIHSRLVEEGKGGSTMRSGSSYSTWWNGGLRTVTYFHNMIGLLTEIIGNPTPIKIPLVVDKQLPQGDEPLPVAPQEWHYRQSIEYELTNNRAVLDVASRYRETFLYNIYVMGRNSIARGSRDNWTASPKRVEALRLAIGTNTAKATPELYEKILHDPKNRDPRGYILPSDQPDFATATKFVNSLLKVGITVERSTQSFTVAGKTYPAGSYVVQTAQAFRPHVLDMFEPQDHPNDFRYPGGPPSPPYDMAGWTLAFQMGVQFDRIIDGFSGPFAKVEGLLPTPAGSVTGGVTPAGYLISHRDNNSYTLVNRLLKNGADVYWLKEERSGEGQGLGTGTIWVPATPAASKMMADSAKELGVVVHAVAQQPKGEALKLKPVRIALYDQYGGLAPSGWTRWLLEQFEFPFKVVYPATLDAGDLSRDFDVLVLTDGSLTRTVTSRGGGGNGGGGAREAADNSRAGANGEALGNGRAGGGRGAAGASGTAGASEAAGNGGAGGDGAGGDAGGANGARSATMENTPAEYQPLLGRITRDKTIPQIRKFIENGGSVVTVGSGTNLAEMLGLPVRDHLAEKGPDGKDRPLPREKFYIPGSLMHAQIDNTQPLAYGMPKQVDVMFDSSPVFRLAPDAQQRHVSAVAWYSGQETLSSGWAWGQQYLDGGVAVAEISVGEGKVVLLGPEVTFRGQPHATFKLLFNGLYYGSAKSVMLE